MSSFADELWLRGHPGRTQAQMDDLPAREVDAWLSGYFFGLDEPPASARGVSNDPASELLAEWRRPEPKVEPDPYVYPSYAGRIAGDFLWRSGKSGKIRRPSWADFFDQLEACLDECFPAGMFGGDLYYVDGSGVDTSNGHGLAALRALRLAVRLGRGMDE